VPLVGACCGSSLIWNCEGPGRGLFHRAMWASTFLGAGRRGGAQAPALRLAWRCCCVAVAVAGPMPDLALLRRLMAGQPGAFQPIGCTLPAPAGRPAVARRVLPSSTWFGKPR